MSDQKVAEKTIEVLDLGKCCLLTLTNKHLRGQILRLIKEPGKSPKKIKDQVDVLLSGIAGYTLEHENNLAKRIGAALFGVIILIGSVYCWQNMGWESWYWGALVGALVALFGWLGNPDTYCFALNIMGSKTVIPVVASKTQIVQEFITKLQNAKIAYDEM